MLKIFFICVCVFTLGAAAQISHAQTTASTAERGIELYQQADYKGAADILQQVVAVEENNKQAWLFLGMALARQDSNKKAKKAFGKADDIEEIPESDYTNDGDARLKINRKPTPGYTLQARQAQVGGKIKLAVEFGADGQINFVFPVRTLPDGLTEKAIDAARRIEFEPAKKSNKAVTVIKFIEYTFKLY